MNTGVLVLLLVLNRSSAVWESEDVDMKGGPTWVKLDQSATAVCEVSAGPSRPSLLHLHTDGK